VGGLPRHTLMPGPPTVTRCSTLSHRFSPQPGPPLSPSHRPPREEVPAFGAAPYFWPDAAAPRLLAVATAASGAGAEVVVDPSALQPDRDRTKGTNSPNHGFWE